MKIEIDRNNALNRLKTIEYSLNSNDNSRLISQCEYNLHKYQDTFNRLKIVYNKFLNNINSLKSSLPKLDISFNCNNINIEDKISICNELSQKISYILENSRNERYNINSKLSENKEKINQVQKEINLLRDKKLLYPQNTTRLKNLIETEFQNRHIISDVYIFCDTLEITDNSWQNAIEGYLNTQRFYILVERLSKIF